MVNQHRCVYPQEAPVHCWSGLGWSSTLQDPSTISSETHTELAENTEKGPQIAPKHLLYTTPPNKREIKASRCGIKEMFNLG